MDLVGPINTKIDLQFDFFYRQIFKEQKLWPDFWILNWYPAKECGLQCEEEEYKG
jgi:hypothetical protein